MRPAVSPSRSSLSPIFLLTDDLRVLPELQNLTEVPVAISPIALKALVNTGVISVEAVATSADRMADERDWLGAPIYRQTKQLFE